MAAPPVVSLPALAAAIRHAERWRLAQSTSDRLTAEPLVPLYRIGSIPRLRGDSCAQPPWDPLLGDPVTNLTVAEEAAAAAQVVGQVVDRLHRLGTSYAEWRSFDTGAFFDLYPGQADLLVRIWEGVSSFYCAFYADLLLPSFWAAESYWCQRFFPMYQAALPELSRRPAVTSLFGEEFCREIEPQMIQRWQRLVAVIVAARACLVDDVGFLASAGGEQERFRWVRWWQQQSGAWLAPELLPDAQELPTLTLYASFPLPVRRQPGRMRRLRRNRQRQQRRSGPSRS